MGWTRRIIRLALVDAHVMFRQALAVVLEMEPDMRVLAQAGTAAEARLLAGEVDVAILGPELPDRGGIALIPGLRDAHPGCVVLVLTADDDRGQWAVAVANGAAGVLHKSVGLADIVGAIRRVAGGHSLMSGSERAEMLRLAEERRARDGEARCGLTCLTRREREVLSALTQGLSDKEIAVGLAVRTETVRTHMANILGKLGVHSRVNAAVLALRHGAAILG